MKDFAAKTASAHMYVCKRKARIQQAVVCPPQPVQQLLKDEAALDVKFGASQHDRRDAESPFPSLPALVLSCDEAILES